MSRHNKFIVSLLIHSVALFSGLSANGQNSTLNHPSVTGVVVDDNKKPIEGAVVSLFYERCNSCPDQIYPGLRTPSNGFFSLPRMTSSENAVLFIDDVEPEHFLSPLSYLLEEERLNIRILSGIRLYVGKRGRSLGKVKVPYRYGKMIIDLPENQNYSFKDITSVNLIIKENNGRVVDKAALPQSAFNSDFSKLMIALPVQGKRTIWRLSIQITYPDKSQTKFDLKINLKKLKCTELSVVNGRQIESKCGQ